MLGVCLLFVGIVLINNGACTLLKADKKAAAVMNYHRRGEGFRDRCRCQVRSGRAEDRPVAGNDSDPLHPDADRMRSLPQVL